MEVRCPYCKELLKPEESMVALANASVDMVTKGQPPVRLAFRYPMSADDNTRYVPHGPCLEEALRGIGFKPLSEVRPVMGNQ